jgi:hypothetical protein
MISIQEKNLIESEFLKKYPSSDALIAWSDSHDKIPKIINDNDYSLGVEIGVAYGGHSESILKNTNIKKLYGIDPYLNYDGYEGDGQCKEQVVMDDIFNFVKKRLSYYNDRFELVREMSNVAVEKFEDNSLDFVYIDGNHFEEYFKEDLNNWWPKIKKGGVMCGHDYEHYLFPEITNYVNYFSSNHNLELHNLGTHVWVIKK